MNKEIKDLFNKYGVKDLKDKNGQSECYCCKNIKHKFSLTWTSFLYEYNEDYYCFDCLLTILLQKENKYLEHNWNELKNFLILCANFGTKEETYPYEHILSKMQELEEGGNNE